MTPLQIRMVLHYYAVNEPYAANEPWHASSDAVRDQRSRLIGDGILKEHMGLSGYTTTERGNAYVNALCALPFPIQKWVMPDTA